VPANKRRSERLGLNVEKGLIEHPAQSISQVVGHASCRARWPASSRCCSAGWTGFWTACALWTPSQIDHPIRAPPKSDVPKLKLRLNLLQVSILLAIFP